MFTVPTELLPNQVQLNNLNQVDYQVMARTKSYVKAEVLEVLEADEGGDDAEIESPQSPSSTGSDDDSDVSVESPQKKAKMPERQVVFQTTL